MTRMPHLSAMTWDEVDQLRSTTPNAGGTPQVTWYAYDGGGQRARKVTDQPGTTVRKAERIYLGAVEVYREYAADGTTITLSRETLHVTDGEPGRRPGREPHHRHRQGLRGTRPLPARQPPGLGPAGTGRRGEHHHVRGVLPLRHPRPTRPSPPRRRPRSATATPAKNATSETGLYYIGARYYAPWLGRWTACDPRGPTARTFTPTCAATR